MSEISARCFLFVGNISATICKNLIFKIFYLVRKVFLICAKSDIIPEDEGLKEKIEKVIADADTRGVTIEVVPSYGKGASKTEEKDN